MCVYQPQNFRALFGLGVVRLRRPPYQQGFDSVFGAASRLGQGDSQCDSHMGRI
jgi:hypothetical protein